MLPWENGILAFSNIHSYTIYCQMIKLEGHLRAPRNFLVLKIMMALHILFNRWAIWSQGTNVVSALLCLLYMVPNFKSVLGILVNLPSYLIRTWQSPKQIRAAPSCSSWQPLSMRGESFFPLAGHGSLDILEYGKKWKITNCNFPVC